MSESKEKMMETSELIRLRILSTAGEEFFRHGFSKVTVDEIATRLGISKKTIYKYFSSKDELLRDVTRATMNEIGACCSDILKDEGIEFVDKLRNMMTTVGVHYSKLAKPLIEDLQKHAPHIWKEIADFRTERINKDFGALLQEGMEKGIFRRDIDRQLILLIYGNAIQTIINPEMLMNLPYTATQIFETIMKVMFEGILTEEAKPKYLSGQSILSVAKQRI